MRRFILALSWLVLWTTASQAQQWLKQSTAVTVKVGPFVDSLDGNTAKTSLAIQKADVRLSKNGGDYAAASADQGASDAGAPHDELGEYDISLNATDTNTPGLLKVIIKENGALAVWKEFMVVPTNVHDSLIGQHATDTLQTDVTQFGGTNGTFSGGRAEVNVSHLSGDSAAADNLEDAFDEESGSAVAMALQSLTVSNPNGNGITVSSTGGNGHGVQIVGDGSGNGMQISSGATAGSGLLISGIDAGIAAIGAGSGSSHGIWASAQTGSGHGIFSYAGGSGDGIHAAAGTTGNGMQLDAGPSGGDDVRLTGNDAPSLVSVLTNQLAPADGSITNAKFAAGAINRASLAADTGLQSIRSGTAQAGDAMSITLDASASGTPDFYKHNYIYLTGGTGMGQYRLITAYNATSKVATVTPAWVANPDGNSTFAILPAGMANVEAWLGDPVVTPTIDGVPEVDITHVLGDPVCD